MRLMSVLTWCIRDALQEREAAGLLCRMCVFSDGTCGVGFRTWRTRTARVGVSMRVTPCRGMATTGHDRHDLLTFTSLRGL